MLLSKYTFYCLCGEKALSTPEKKRYYCIPCGYLYDPVEGDPDYGVEAGTAFEELPDNWVCPICGASQDMFEPESDS